MREANKYMSLKLLLAIQDNQYRGADSTGMQDYAPESVDREIWDKMERIEERETKRKLKELEDYENEIENKEKET